jgi:putative heme transporter
MNTPTATPRWLHASSDIAWRLLVLAAVVVVVTAALWKLRVVTLPIFIALLACAALAPLVTRLEAHGWPPLAATLTVLVVAVLVVGGLIAAAVVPALAQADEIADAVSEGLADVEDWLVEGPLGIQRETVDRWTENPTERITEMAGSSSTEIIAGVRTAGEVFAGALLALILTVLFLKDGRRFQRWALGHLPPRHHDLSRALGRRSWSALGGYLRGATILGLVEGVIIGITLWLVGSPLWGPIAVFTFLLAYFPVVGAVIAAVAATLVALATGGVGDAAIVAAVSLAVQQLDGDLLAPVVYGQSLKLHPALVVIVLTAGGVLGGIAGAFLAVPVAGAVVGMSSELWSRTGRSWAADGQSTVGGDAEVVVSPP